MTKSTLSVPEASDMLNVHPNTVFKLIEAGALPAAKIGRAYVLLTKDVMQYLDAFMLMLSSQNSNQHLLLLPLQDALEHVAFPEGDR